MPGKLHLVDAALCAENTAQHTADARLKSQVVAQHTVDGAIQIELQTFHSVDAAIMEAGKTAQHTVDGAIQGFDTIAHTIDGAIKAFANTQQHTVDSALYSETTTQHTIDAALHAENTAQHNIDGALFQAGKSVQHEVDAALYQENQRLLAHQIDAALAKEDTAQHTLDAALSFEAVSQHSVDAALRGEKNASHNVDAVLYELSGTTIQFLNAVDFQGSVLNQDNVIDGDDDTYATIDPGADPDKTSSVRLYNPDLPDDYGSVDTITCRIKWEAELPQGHTTQLATVYWRNGSSGAWTQVYQDTPGVSPEAVTFDVPSATLSDLEILVERFYGAGGGNPDDPPEFSE